MLRAFGDALFGEQFGASPAKVLALPGWMRQRKDFDGVLDGLDAIALDLPGFGGASPEPPTAMDAAGYAAARRARSSTPARPASSCSGTPSAAAWP